MDITLEMPRQRTTAPILAISILLGILLYPALERALMKWMPGSAQATQSQSGGGASSWDLRSMWN